MEPYKASATLKEDGTLTLEHLPFRAGDRVEVIVVLSCQQLAEGSRYPLRGSVLHYQNPTEPVGEGDWEAAMWS